MKKVICLLIMAVLTVSLFGAGQREEAETEEMPRVLWRLSHTQSPEHFMHDSAVLLSEYVAEQTNGNFVIEVHHSGTLGWEREVLESMQLGTMAMTWSAVGPFADFVPSYNLFTLPGIFSGLDQMKAVYEDEEVLNRLREDAAERNLMELGTGQYVFRDTFLNSHPVLTPEDLRGKRIRVMGVPILVDTYSALGANVTTTAWAELYSALQLGVVDGIDHVPTSVRAMKFYEILRYGSRIPIFASPMLLVASKPLYDRLPDHYQDILREGVRRAIEHTNEQSLIQTETAIEYLESQGMEYYTPDPEPFLELVRPVREKYMAELEPWAQDVVRMIEEMD